MDVRPAVQHEDDDHDHDESTRTRFRGDDQRYLLMSNVLVSNVVISIAIPTSSYSSVTYPGIS